ncbi:aliphatic sulfonate ABC transporter substrate-binding protein [Rhizobacter sp. J219]|jgi:sulfonate transport system substrate-binding protein|uniref:aliphatic sulfonate ABC transporter substrate-binding protein n=1 Tax=Rhizobacter sp. J219 TaxID=2898430 RepID=UPI0021513B65|nr:aliphatic sulfonate ABC transporter substrate-binding protein [Rhizobacter sp. J219]MCR5885077.1 aliphatic sulfonate ABC transporter substrate-binding protein [Rhizobacter sp. J219]
MTQITRRSALGVLSVTAASWWPAARANSPAPLRIGFQKGSINLTIVKSLKLVERRLPGTPVQWVEFPAGPQLLEALAVGSVDFGAVGDSPPVFAQAAGKDVFYVGAEPAKPDTSALLVRAGSPLKTLADLKGRRVAVQKGSSAHYLLVQAVKKGGLQWADIQPVYLAPADARAAFERGAVDAWSIWDPYYAAAEIDGQARPLVTSRGLTSNNSFYLASRALTQQEPVLRLLFAALTEADAYVDKNRTATAQQYAEFAGLGLATVLRFLERRPRSPVGPLNAALVAEQQKVADAFHELGLIPKAIRVADIVWQPGQAVAQAR